MVQDNITIEMKRKVNRRRENGQFDNIQRLPPNLKPIGGGWEQVKVHKSHGTGSGGFHKGVGGFSFKG